MRVSGAASFAALAVLTLIVYRPLLDTRPFEGDILYMLAWADAARPADLHRVDPDAYPEWRPLPYATVWLQYRLAATDHLWTYYFANLLAWTACGWLVHRLVQVLSGSFAGGLAAAAIVLTSTQPISTIVLIEERQSSLACLFGLAAWLIVARSGSPRLTRTEGVGVAVLLLASALSKEYGLAFAGAMAVYALYDRHWSLAAAATAATGIYAALRIVLVGGATAPFCEDQGYFFAARFVCFDGLGVVPVTQAGYNVAATAIGSLLPGMIADDGRIDISPRWVVISIILLASAALGWAQGDKRVRIGIFVIGFNAVLSFLLYRSRNHAAAICALGVATGVGFPIAAVALRQLAGSPLIRVTAIAALLGIVAIRGNVAHRLVAERVERASHPDVCGSDSPDLDRAFMRRVFLEYDVPLPECLAVEQPPPAG